MLIKEAILPPAASEYASPDIELKITHFLYREARLLDTENYPSWLALMTEDIHYWMPVQENRNRKDSAGTFCTNRMAFFDDSYRELKRRVDRFVMPTAWAEDPRTRHVHSISNIEVFTTENPMEYEVHSVFTNYRNTREIDQDIIMGRRKDLLRQVEGEYYIAKRLILIAQNVLLSKNINTFF